MDAVVYDELTGFRGQVTGSMPGIRAMGLDVGGTVNGLGIGNGIISAGELLEGFESVSNTSPAIPSGWSITPTTNWSTLTYAGSTAWKTELTKSYLINGSSSSQTAGQTFIMTKQFNTPSGSIFIDMNLAMSSSITPMTARIKINGTTVYTQTTGTFVGTKSFTGYGTTVTLSFEIADTSENSSRTATWYIDNIRTSEQYGYLLKSLARINLDRIIFPKIYKPANTKCQVDVCGMATGANFPVSSATSNTLTLSNTPYIASSMEPSTGNVCSGWTTLVLDTLSTVTANTSWKTQGSESCQLFVSNGAGQNVLRTTSIGRSFDLTGVNSLVVDLNFLTINVASGYVSVFEILVGGTTLFSVGTSQGASAYIDANRTLDVSAFNGTHQVIIRVRNTSAVGSASTATMTVAVDNLRFTPTSASVINDFYKDDIVVVTSGTGSGQTRKITAYNGTTKVATLDQAWTTTPTTASFVSFYDGIPSAQAVSPGFDLQSIDYTTYPTINIICSLERQAGATASPSMGVPVVTSIEKDWVSQAPVFFYNATTTYATALSVSGRCSLDGICFKARTQFPILRITVDGVVLYNDVRIASGDGDSESVFVPFKLIANSSLLIETKSNASGGTGGIISYSK